MQKKNWLWTAALGLLLLMGFAFIQRPELIWADWMDLEGEEDIEYQEVNLYVGNEYRIPIWEEDFNWRIVSWNFSEVEEDYEAQEYIFHADSPGDVKLWISNSDEQKNRYYLFHIEYGPYRFTEEMLETLQKKSCINRISGLKAEELSAVNKGTQVKASQTGETLKSLEFWLEDEMGTELPNADYLKHFVKNGKIYFKFLKDGNYTLNFRLTVSKDGLENGYEDSCSVFVEAVGFPDQPFAVAVGGERKAPLQNYTKVNGYSSSDESVVVVEADGTIRGIAQGEAVIKATGITANQTEEATECVVTVTNPRLKSKPPALIPSYGYQTIELEGVENYSKVELTSSNEEIVWAGGWNSYYGGSFGGRSGGTARLTVTVDGKKLYSRKITVYDPGLPEGVCVAVGEKNKALMDIKLPSPESTVAYTSSDWSVVNVNKSLGRIKGSGEGKAEITVAVDDFQFTVPVFVITDKKIAKALNYALTAIGTSYSQSKRMQEGYYDCSSLVWRAYHSAGVSVGGSSTYAPTAANMAKYMVEHGEEIKDLHEVKVGDLLFSEGDGERFRGIWHVAVILDVEWETDFWSGGQALSILEVEAGSGGVQISSGYLTEEIMDQYTIARPSI